MDSGSVVVVGLGEVGQPLLELASRTFKVVGVDIEPPADQIKGVDVLHICFPYQVPDFVGESARYIDMFEPRLTVINSTVQVGTTRAVSSRARAAVAYSPIRGKHARMLEDLERYAKFVGAPDQSAAEAAARHFEAMGLDTRLVSSSEVAEIAKLTETSFFGLMIAWAQEVERYALQASASYDEIVSFYEEIGFFPPVKYFPGVIGGHCVMPNIELLQQFTDSDLLKAIEASNTRKIALDESMAKAGATE